MAIEIESEDDAEVETIPVPKGPKGKESIRKQIDSQRNNETPKRKASSELAR
jgi:hypothetical protein